MNREEWTIQAYEWLCKLLGAPENENQERNLREWAAAFEENYYEEGYSPEDAVREDLSYAT